MKLSQSLAVLLSLGTAAAFRDQTQKKILSNHRHLEEVCMVNHDTAKSFQEIVVHVKATNLNDIDGPGTFEITMRDLPYAPPGQSVTTVGWCIDFDRSIRTNDYSVDVFSAFDSSIHTNAVDKRQYLPNLAWLINNVAVGDYYPAGNGCMGGKIGWHEMQGAVWMLVDDKNGQGTIWQQRRMNCISKGLAKRARVEGMNYELDCHDMNEQVPLVMVVDNDQTGEITNQVIISETLLSTMPNMCECGTPAPETPAPTDAPMTPAPTDAPMTPAPTDAPMTPAPTDAPMTPAPTDTPETPAPTEEPVPEEPTPEEKSAEDPTPEKPEPEVSVSSPEEPTSMEPAPEQPAPEQPEPEQPVGEEPNPEQPEQPTPYKCEDDSLGTETAFAYHSESALCFLDDEMNNFNTWGWTISIPGTHSGTYTYDVYAGAGRCDLTKGEIVGTVMVSYDAVEETCTGSYDSTGDNKIMEFQFYCGPDSYPQKNGKDSVAPDCYSCVQDSVMNPMEAECVVEDVVGSDIHFIAHAVSCVSPNTPEEMTPEEPTPEEPTPEELAPEQPAPEQPMPEEPAPEERTPEDPTPEKPEPEVSVSSPEEPTPMEPAPEQPAPEQPEQEQPMPEQPMPEEPGPEESTPEEPGPEESTPEQPAPEESSPEQYPVPEQPAPEESMPEQPAPEESMPEQPAPEPMMEEPNPEPPVQEREFCNDDQRMCPDGSFVARSGPDCEFPECPSEIRVFGAPPTSPKRGSGSGDPHFKTWTGDKYDYHGECDLVLVDNPTFMHGLGLRVHIRTTRVKYFSYIEKVAVQIGSDVLEFDNDVEKFLINGKLVEKNKKHHKTMLGGFVVRRDPRALSIRLHDQGSAKSHNHKGAKIDLHTRKNGFPAVIVDAGGTHAFKGSLGLLGDWKTGRKLARDGKTEFIGINGPEDDASAFALEWQVRHDEPHLFKESRFPQYPTKCTPPAKIPRTKRLGSAAMMEKAEKACAHWEEDMDDCIFDVMATQDLFVADEGHIVHME